MTSARHLLVVAACLWLAGCSWLGHGPATVVSAQTHLVSRSGADWHCICTVRLANLHLQPCRVRRIDLVFHDASGTDIGSYRNFMHDVRIPSYLTQDYQAHFKLPAAMAQRVSTTTAVLKR